MTDEGVLEITDAVWIPRTELTYRATRSGGPGGQHVNTSSTRIELTWNVADTPNLDEAQRARVREKLANRIDGDGVLHLSASDSRSQHQNKEAVTERFQELLRQALEVPKARKRTRPSRAAREERLGAKRRQSEKKRMRSDVSFEE
jgi:ribosome-associated protein